MISRTVINETTSTWDRFTWIESERRWKPYFSLPRDYCDNYGLCGANGNCVLSDSPVCQCLKGFRPKSQEQWISMDWSQGCIRNNPLNCQMDKQKVGFLKFSGLKLPDTANSWVNKDMNLKECRAKCLSNCSCMAYSNSDIRGQGSGCAIWFGQLMDIRQNVGGGQDLYVRMPDSELGMSLTCSQTILNYIGVRYAMSSKNKHTHIIYWFAFALNLIPYLDIICFLCKKKKKRKRKRWS